MSTQKPEISIPILTQIIAPASDNAQSAAKKTARPDAQAASVAQKSVTPLFASQMVAAASPAAATSPSQPEVKSEAAPEAMEGDWKMLELKLNERVLRQILRRVDFVIEHRVKESLSEVLQATTDGMIKDIRQGLHVTLQDIIKRAVAQEIARVQSIKE